jgi:hypothetical protein
MGQLVHRPVAKGLAGCGFRRLQQRIALLVARPGYQPVDGQQQDAVVGPQREHRGVHIGAGEDSVELTNVSH